MGNLGFPATNYFRRRRIPHSGEAGAEQEQRGGFRDW